MTRSPVIVVTICLLLAAVAGYAGVDAASQALLGDEERVAIEVEASVEPEGVADDPEWYQQEVLGARFVEANETTRTPVSTPDTANGSGGESISGGRASVPNRTDPPAATKTLDETTPTPTPDPASGDGQIPEADGKQVSQPGTGVPSPSTSDKGPTAGRATPEATSATDTGDTQATTGGETGEPGDVDEGTEDGSDVGSGDGIENDGDGGEDGASPNVETAGGDTTTSGLSTDTDAPGATSGTDPVTDGKETGQ